MPGFNLTCYHQLFIYMKQVLPIAVTVGFLILSCNQGPAPASNKDTLATKITPIRELAEVAGDSEKECYAYISGKDSILLSVRQHEGKVSGELVYAIYEKDRNTGSISGKMSGDTLYAEYNFISEGSPSIREVVFLKKADTFTEGYGTPEEKNGKTIFADKTAISFGNIKLLKQEKCW
jgi:hypothetical protein